MKQSAENTSAKPARSQRPTSQAFRDFMASGWSSRSSELPARAPVAEYTGARREALSKLFRGARLVIPAGGLKTRSNDTDYRFRPHSAFAYLTGFGTDHEPDAVLVLEPSADGHDPELYFRPRAERDAEEFYADTRYGELWVGARPTLAEVEAEYGIVCRHIDELSQALSKDADGPGGVALRIVRDADPVWTAAVDEIRIHAADSTLSVEEQEKATEDEIAADAFLTQSLSELRLVKDDFEIARMRDAVDATIDGFAQIVKALPQAVEHPRGERVIETEFESQARRSGNGVGYETIAASGDHACTLHWIRNDGPVRRGDLILVDAGVEDDSLYTADITRTLPVSGTFTQTQREIYQAVLDAADSAFDAAVPGAKFSDVHAAAMEVILERLNEWGLLPVSVDEARDLSSGGQYRRWMVHGTSHHLGIDVHDCAQARREMYLDAQLEPGMIFTIEPGLYFKSDDLLVPEEFRGIGVRIEDDILVNATGAENLSRDLPRTVDDVEKWMSHLWSH